MQHKADLIPETNEYRLDFFIPNKKTFKMFLGKIKAIPGAWYSPNLKRWMVPNNPETLEVLHRLGFPVEKPEDEPEAFVEYKPPWKDDPIPTWAGFLRDYQLDGLRFISWLVQEGKSGLLLDSMGIGKSIQAISFTAMFPEMRPGIIVTTASTKLQWAAEFRKFEEYTGYIPIEVLSGRTPHELTDMSLIYLINWDTLYDWRRELYRIGPAFIIGDEIQAIGNVINNRKPVLRTQAFVTIARRARFFLGLSGTPIESRVEQIFTSLNLADPQVFPNRYAFRWRYCDPVHDGFRWTYNGVTNAAELRSKMAPYVLRRRKVDVLKELPPKQRTIIPLEIEDLKQYKEMERGILDSLSGNDVRDKARLEALKDTVFDLKKEACARWIDEYLNITGEKLVVFTWHRAATEWIYDRFRKRAVMIYGGVSESKRNEAQERFWNDPKTDVFIGNLKSAGTGLNLQVAPATITLEIQSRPFMHLQGESRVERIGQEANHIDAYYTVAMGTVEEELFKILDSRLKDFREVFDGGKIDDSDLFDTLLDEYRRV
jgi:SWI/SNF-related matrix-associated actin-dependent regulator 1 of chromatin subfamily A